MNLTDETKLTQIFDKYVDEAIDMLDEVEMLDLLPVELVITLYNRYRGLTIAETRQYTDTGLYEIRFCSKLFKKWVEEENHMEIMDTLLHELCHTMPNALNHGPTWKSYVQRINFHFGMNIKRLRD